MGDIAIRVENLGKQYRIGGPRARYRTIRESVVEAAKAPFRRLSSALRGDGSRPDGETIWALKDVSFEVERGEVVGIIGRNGAGKSTLLKVLSRITEPTEGWAEIHGRVGSLLEVGTGFHPELTGRENVYLSGAVLGMRREEIDRRFDEIVDFSGVEQFLDTPLKHYSSGMQVRLGFAVAAHLEPEILLVDEVLAVGDAAFQRKCLGKMGEVARGGRTVLFVSHNTPAVRNLCMRAIWLDAGRLVREGHTDKVVDAYLRANRTVDSLSEVPQAIAALAPDSAFRLVDIQVRQDGRSGTSVGNGRPIEIEIHYEVLEPTAGLRVYFDLLDDEGAILIRSFHDDDAHAMVTVRPGKYVSRAMLPCELLAPRRYELRVHGTIYNVRSCTPGGVGVSLLVEATGRVGRAYPGDSIRARLQPRIPWETAQVGQVRRGVGSANVSC